MAIFSIEVDGVPEGYEPVAYRKPKAGEEYLPQPWHVSKAHADFENAEHIIVRPVWQWPEWLAADWIAMDATGAWWAYSKHNPSIFKDCFKNCCPRIPLSGGSFNFTPPPCDDWKQSLRRNPNKGGE